MMSLQTLITGIFKGSLRIAIFTLGAATLLLAHTPSLYAQASSTIVNGSPINCQGLRYIVLNQKIGGALNDVAHACGFTSMIGEGLRQQARTGSYTGDFGSVLTQFNSQQPLHWGRINNTFYADDAARSGSASIELHAMTRAAFEQVLSNNRISVSASQVTHDAASNIYRINGPVTFVTDLEQTLSNIRSRATVSTDSANIQGIKVIKFGVISRAAN